MTKISKRYPSLEIITFYLLVSISFTIYDLHLFHSNTNWIPIWNRNILYMAYSCHSVWHTQKSLHTCYEVSNCYIKRHVYIHKDCYINFLIYHCSSLISSQCIQAIVWHHSLPSCFPSFFLFGAINWIQNLLPVKKCSTTGLPPQPEYYFLIPT